MLKHALTGRLGIEALNRKAARAMPQWIAQLEPSLLATLAFNDGAVSPWTARQKLKEWDARLSRPMAGPGWSSKPGQRPRWIAVLERPSVNSHWHVAVAVPGSDLVGQTMAEVDFGLRAPTIWQSLNPKGNADIRQVYFAEGAASYLSKELLNPTCYNSFIVSDEFRSG